jgi:hypothetical protein
VNVNSYVIGHRYYWSAFSSTSKSLDIAKEFGGPTAVIFVMTVAKNAPYHNIEINPGWSYFPREQEVLLFPNFYFEVTKIENKGPLTMIHVREISHSNILSFKRFNQKKLIWADTNINSDENL